MANISKRGRRWRAEVCVDRSRRARTFDTKREAQAWATEQEDSGLPARKTLAEALARYRPIAESHKGAQSELSRLKSLGESKLAKTYLERLSATVVAEWRDERLKDVAPVSVRREMIILSAVLRLCRMEWGWMRNNPLTGVTRPQTSAPRRRGMPDASIKAVCAALADMRQGPQVDQMLTVSLETAMRLSEITGLRWVDVSEKHVRLSETKNGDQRFVPLSPTARTIIDKRRGMDDESVFTLAPDVASKTFQRAVRAAGLIDVHFHDARSEAITRLSKKLDILQLAKMIGHRDLDSLMIYYAESPDDIADRL